MRRGNANSLVMTAAGATALAAGSGALGQINILTDDRRAYAGAFAQSVNASDSFSREGIAAHELDGPYGLWIFEETSPSASAGTASATAGVVFQSQTAPSGFSGTASAHFTCQITLDHAGTDEGYYASGQGEALLSVAFEVDLIREWSVQGVVGLTGVGFSSVTLRRGTAQFGDALFHQFALGPQDAISHTIILPPGQYRFEAYAGAFGAAFFTDYFDGTATFDVTFTRTGQCPIDLSDDGQLDSADLSLFVDAFIAADARADLTSDGVVDSGDLAVFVAFFLAGCPA
jgi:hypothetical protein